MEAGLEPVSKKYIYRYIKKLQTKQRREQQKRKVGLRIQEGVHQDAGCQVTALQMGP